MARNSKKRSSDAQLTPDETKAAKGETNAAKGAFTIQWKREGTLIVGENEECKPSSKIAAYDLDGTLISTKSGKTFAQNESDWKIFSETVPKKLRLLQEDGYKIVIFSNQKGIGTGKVSEKLWQRKVENIMNLKLNVPVQVLAGTANDKFRKPQTFVWEYFEKNMNGGKKIDLKASFYCGDGAGRPKGWMKGAKKDFADTDRKFGLNIGVPFHTPEEHFLGHSVAPFDISGANPHDYKAPKELLEPKGSKLALGTPEIIILVGFPGSGKSTFYENNLKPLGYLHANRDTLGTWQKCVKKCNEALESGKSCCVDNTNYTAEMRERYIKVAHERGVPARVFVINTPRDFAEHQNDLRRVIPGEEKKHVGRIVMATYNKRFEKPDAKKEGFHSLVHVNFIPTFKDDYHKKLWQQYS